MIDMMAGDLRLRRRLEAYAESRLSPDLATTSRMRARVLAHAHRRADLARADAALTIVRPGAADEQRARRSAAARRTAISLVSAAALAVAMVGGAAAASQAGGALYDARLFVEEITLPAEPSERAIAELDRLSQRLAEADAAARAGDHAAAGAALTAYERIVAEASSEVFAADDPVAAAALETGIGRNVEVLQALIARVPAQAREAISRAVERAIERSANAIDRVHDVNKPTPSVGGGSNGGGSNGGAGNGEQNGTGGAGSGGNGNGGSGVGPDATGKPPKTPAPKPAATPRPTREENERPEPTSKPSKTPKPTAGPGEGDETTEDPQD
jgi:uncharacterized membrane protein YgcG